MLAELNDAGRTSILSRFQVWGAMLGAFREMSAGKREWEHMLSASS